MLWATLPGYSQTSNRVVAHEIKDLPVPIQVFSVCPPSHKNGSHPSERSNYLFVIFGSNGSWMGLHDPGICRHQSEEIRHAERIETRCRTKRPDPPQCVVKLDLIRYGGI